MAQVITFPRPILEPVISRERLSDDEYWAFCEANPDMHIERTAEGEIVVMPPTGGESDYRTGEAHAELQIWARKNGHGVVFGPSVQFFLPDGSGLSPDVSWVSKESLNRLTKAERKKFLRLTPEFVIEVLSPSDRLNKARQKMEVWIANGVQLGWLVDGDNRMVYVYRKGRSPATRRGLQKLSGEGPVAGFVLDLTPIWEGL